MIRRRPTSQFQVYRSRSGEYRWRFLAANHKIIADSGEGYKRKVDCDHGIGLLKVFKFPKGQHLSDVKGVEFYQDSAGRHRWRLRARNGEIIGRSSQGYSQRRDCVHGLRLIQRSTEVSLKDT